MVAGVKQRRKSSTRRQSCSSPRAQRPAEGAANPYEMTNRLLQMDKSGDGKISADELPERMRGILERADTYHDGVLDRDELRQHTQSQAAARPQRAENEARERRETEAQERRERD